LIPIKDDNPLRRLPLITILLIGANLTAYVLAAGHGAGALLDGPSTATLVRYGAIPYALTHAGAHCELIPAARHMLAHTGCSVPRAGVASQSGPAPWQTVFTAMFVHVNVLALLADLVVLAIFGTSIEGALGRLRYAALYVVGGVVGLACQVAVGPASTVPALGAAGAIAAVFGAYFVLYPRARVLSVMLVPYFFSLVKMPAWVLLAAWLVFDILVGVFGVATPFGGGADAGYYAQLGAGGFGLVAVRLFARRAGSQASAALNAGVPAA
jgi:membrane associated rhomboid family serine protease